MDLLEPMWNVELVMRTLYNYYTFKQKFVWNTWKNFIFQIGCRSMVLKESESFNFERLKSETILQFYITRNVILTMCSETCTNCKTSESFHLQVFNFFFFLNWFNKKTKFLENYLRRARKTKEQKSTRTITETNIWSKTGPQTNTLWL